MKKILIAYANDALSYSLGRIGRQARRLNLFDEIILYTPEQLPDYVKKSPLMKYKVGGGYYVWKGAIIWETLQKYDEGDIVFYVDAGCTLRKSPIWSMFFRLMKRYDTVCFQYNDVMPEWEKFGNVHTEIKYWTKKTVLQFFDQYLGDTSYRDFNKIMSGFMFFKGKNNTLVKHWLDLTMEHPEFLEEITPQERKQQDEGFAYHKFEQSIITPLAYYDKTVLVLPEISETCGEDVFVFASRIRARNFRAYVVLRIKYWLRRILGNRLFERCKKIIKK